MYIAPTFESVIYIELISAFETDLIGIIVVGKS
jgi:hypothetical protein